MNQPCGGNWPACRKSLHRHLLDASLRVSLHYRFLEGKITELMWHSPHILSKAHSFNMTHYYLWVFSWPRRGRRFQKGIPFSFLHCALKKEVPRYRPFFAGVSTKLLEFAWEESSLYPHLLICSVIYLHQGELTDVCFVLRSMMLLCLLCSGGLHFGSLILFYLVPLSFRYTPLLWDFLWILAYVPRFCKFIFCISGPSPNELCHQEAMVPLTKEQY